MLIEDVDALKCWLAKLLEPICDADPNALANYVVALVKKDKSEQDLRAFCVDQLDVFLQQATNGFVDKLFEGLYTKDYLKAPEQPKPEIQLSEQENREIQEEQLENELLSAPASTLDSFDEERDGKKKKHPSPHKNRSNSSERSNEVSRRIPDGIEFHSRGPPLEKTLLSNEDKSSLGGNRRPLLEDMMERPDTYSRISVERPREKKREDGKWRDHDRYYERNDLYRDKYDWRRGKSKSPIKNRPVSRSRSPNRGRNREQDISRSRGEHRERTKFESERNELEGTYNPVSMPSSKISDQYSSSGQAIPSAVTVVAPAHHSENTKESWSNYYNNHGAGNSFSRNPLLTKQRCRDYDEMGFCVRGDLCQFDHGNDPLIVDEVTLPGIIPFPPPPGLPPPGMLLPPLPAPPNMRMPVPHSQGPPPGVPPMPVLPLTQSNLINNREHPRTATVPSHAPVGARLPPPLPPNLLYTASEISCNYPLAQGMQPFPRSRGPILPPLSKKTDDTYEPDGYNPEAPSISVSGRSQFRQFYTRSLTQRSNLIGLTSGDMDSNPRANIVIQTDSPTPVTTESTNNRVVVEPDRKRPMAIVDGPPAKKPWLDKQGSNNLNKPIFNKRIQFTNTKLEVRKVPPELNNITKLNEHFSKFGTIVNIQVAFQGDPEGALIQYVANDEARRAISSTEAVLNNRFIKLMWHRENDQQHQPHQPYQQQSQPQHHHHPPHYNHQTQTNHTAPATSTPVNIPTVSPKPQGPGAYVLNKVSAKNNLGQASGNQSETNQSTSTVDDCQPFSITTNHTKTVYSSANMKSSAKSLTSKPVDAQEALKKKQEALKLQYDMKKKKQEMLEKQIECQKMLISKLEKNKTMKAEERGEIMKTLKELEVKISQLKDELKNSSTTSASSKPKSKTEAQKELLDAEMDFHKRLTSGEDTTELRKKLSQLQVEAARLGLLSTGRGKTMPAQSRGRGRGRGGRGRSSLNTMVVDHRPKSLAVSGFMEEEKEDVLQHFAKFGSIEDLKEEDSPLNVVLMFKTRSEAETAANQGSRFRGRRLQVSWHKPKTPSISTEIEEEEPKEEETEPPELFLHEDDDEDEDEDESRSWRR
ncbi:RNA-binding protein 27 isoform X2 [Pleurodeles waltl]|uniref:RNA-binding protein 27 isoform X2 n=1 Tax=Pleurodeles waltl TaxID=8319 RepID=UPI003709663C